MNGYSGSYPNRPYPAPNNGSSMMDLAPDGLNGYDMVQGQSLDSIVAHNDHENRRRSMPVYARNTPMNLGSPDTRRLSMMNFGDPAGRNMDDFQFDMSAAAMDGMMRTNTAFPRTTADLQNDRLPAADVAVNTQYPPQNSPYSTMAGPGSTYASPMHQKSSLDVGITPYPSGMAMPLDMDDSLNMMSPDMNMYPSSRLNSSMLESPVNQESLGPMPAPPQENTASAMQRPDLYKNRSLSSNTPEARSGGSGYPSRAGSQDQSSMRSNSRPQSEQHSSTSIPTRMSLASLNKQQPVAQDPAVDLSQETMKKQFNSSNVPFNPPAGGFPSTMHSNPHSKTHFKNAYSATGFDMLGVLVCSVDVSISFVALTNYRCALRHDLTPRLTLAP